ncbi:MAG: hypothetical protein K8R53_03345 [Bacteroidales bacterium]|nr:hypothetical protein [Bacteroidales bacterium]
MLYKSKLKGTYGRIYPIAVFLTYFFTISVLSVAPHLSNFFSLEIYLIFYVIVGLFGILYWRIIINQEKFEAN